MRFIRKYWLEILLHILVWVAIFYVLDSLGSASKLSVNMKSMGKGTITSNAIYQQRTIAGSLYPFSLIVIGFLMLLFYTNAFWLFNKLMKWQNGYLQFAVVAVWFAFLFFADYFLVGFLKNSGEPETIHILQLVIPNPARYTWWHIQINVLFIFLFTLGASVAYFFSKAWIKNELIRKQMQAHQLSTEIKFLKSQINPHFLFNTLNNLFSMAQGKGNEELADGISKLSDMMRYMIYESNAESVPLKKEIEYLEDSILLNKLRYADDEVRVVFKYPADVTGLFIAPMIFIPFVENAFKHGVLIGQTSQIDIFILVVNKEVIFTCENKNYSFIKKMNDPNSGIGLENVKRRLELMYGDKYELVIKNEAHKYSVMLKLNLQ